VDIVEGRKMQKEFFSETLKKRMKWFAKALCWMIGIYVALFGLVSQRYQSKISIIENRINNIITSLSTPGFEQAISRIPETQKMLCPVEPDLLMFWKTLESFVGFKSPYTEGVLLLKRTIENWQDSLSNVILDSALLDSAVLEKANLEEAYLEGVDFEGANLWGANLRDAILNSANLKGAHLNETHLEEADLTGANLAGADLLETHLEEADLTGANLAGADLLEAHLEEADLTGANLRKADFEGADLKEADLTGANLSGADLEEANLQGAYLDSTDLSKVKSLYLAKLDTNILSEIKTKWPEKLATGFDTTKKSWVIDDSLLEQIKKPDWHGWPEGKDQGK
jgi:uncharacterized protein YjbI with pentapeptide repeats